MNPDELLTNNGLIIFLFHGVINKQKHKIRNYKQKHIEKKFFSKFIKKAKKKGIPLSMDEIVDYCKTNDPFPPRSFAITFDDGYENNFSIAAPILNQYEIPATFYITTDFVDNNHMTWIDRIEYCLENTSKGRLTLPWNQKEYIFYNDLDKIKILDIIRKYAKRDRLINLDDLVNSVFYQCNIAEIKSNKDPLDLKMSWEKVKELNENEKFIIGGHGHTHKNLAFLSKNELNTEIETSIKLIEKNIGLKIIHYSYPEGLSFCYSDRVIKTLKKYGIICCPTAEEGINQKPVSLYHLKRIPIIKKD